MGIDEDELQVEPAVPIEEVVESSLWLAFISFDLFCCIIYFALAQAFRFLSLYSRMFYNLNVSLSIPK